MKLALIIIGILVIAGLIWVLIFPNTNNQTTNAGEMMYSQQSAEKTAKEVKPAKEKETKASPTASSTTSGLANPASVNCAKVGGTSKIMTNGSGGQYGLCQFADDQACEEWALFRGQCPVGGVKTIGYDTIQESYCAWSGGQTIDGANPTCTFKNGKVCSDADLYNGACSAN